MTAPLTNDTTTASIDRKAPMENWQSSQLKLERKIRNVIVCRNAPSNTIPLNIVIVDGLTDKQLRQIRKRTEMPNKMVAKSAHPRAAWKYPSNSFVCWSE